jgi:L-aspartate oxidase
MPNGTSRKLLPQRLDAPGPGWFIDADIVVVGSGIAGLTAALQASATGRVLLVTKVGLSSGSTRWAQGGIAAAIGPGDSPQQHSRDTLIAGAGVCDPAAVEVLVTEGPGALRRLIDRGATFDRDDEGHIALTREGGHRQDRIAHAGGDATGAEVSRALVAAVKSEPRIEVIEHALALDLLLDADQRTAGLTLHVLGAGARDGVGAARAPVVILATGGFGQVFSQTTNPAESTGDGVALAMRAGAFVADMEFVQFHPTVLYLGPRARGQQPLVSEAVRGEGAFLVDDDGQRFMVGVHELADLAPRDVVAKAVMRRMRETGAPHVWLDGRALGDEVWNHRFPTILESCLAHGVDPRHALIPVSPAAHYVSGGVRTDLVGRTNVPGLFACGECACTGVHGANRLASNSLLEGLVFAERIAAYLAREGVPTCGEPIIDRDDKEQAYVVDPSVREHVAAAMTDGAGVLRSRQSLGRTLGRLVELRLQSNDDPHTEAWEATNVLMVATALTVAARQREETRGSHWREDFPATDDVNWRGHLVDELNDGFIDMTFEEIG